MLEKEVRNSLIGIKEENGISYLEFIDHDNNIKKANLINFVTKKKNNSIEVENKDECLCGFKKQKKIIGTNDSQKSIDELVKTINIKDIENTLNEITKNYKIIIDTLERKIEEFKKRNDAQILLVKNLINIYNSSSISKNITKELLLNLKNIVQFNELNIDSFMFQINSVDFRFNILKPFPIENLLEEKILIRKIQNNTTIQFKENIKSLLILEKLNKIIAYSENKLFLFNPNNYKIQNEIESKNDIISLNLMKDNTILVSHSDSISKLKIKNNKMILENYISGERIDISYPGIIVDYKSSLAWTNDRYIEIYGNNYYDIDKFLDNYSFSNGNMECSGGYSITTTFLYSFTDDILLYAYLFEGMDHHGQSFPKLYLSLYNKEMVKNKDYKLFLGNETYTKIFKLNYEVVVVFGGDNFFDLNVYSFKTINIINVNETKKSINNCFLLNKNYYMYFLDGIFYDYYDFRENEEEKENENNVFVIKIEENSDKIIFASKMNVRNYFYGKEGDKYFYLKNNLIPQIISVRENYVIIEELL